MKGKKYKLTHSENIRYGTKARTKDLVSVGCGEIRSPSSSGVVNSEVISAVNIVRAAQKRG
jgi:hypothetical protein